MPSLNKQIRKRGADERDRLNAELTPQQKLDRALAKGGSAKEVKRLRKVLGLD